MPLRFAFVFLYLLVDVVYVTMSRARYEGVVRKIQGSGEGYPEIKGTRAIGAIIAYTCMVIGWLFFVAPPIEAAVIQKNASKTHTLKIGALAGLVYGMLVYGVFNGTLHVMFKNYDITIAIRDTVWGISWAVLLSMMYAYALTVFATQ